MTDLTELLNEYETWKTRKAFSAGVPNSPADFMQEKRIQRIIAAIRLHLNDARGDRYPLEEYLEREDLEWIATSATAQKALDRTE